MYLALIVSLVSVLLQGCASTPAQNALQSTAQKRPERYWLVLLFMFQICRREEAGQLYLKDVQDSPEGIAYLNITDAEKDQMLKSEGSSRKVPLRCALLKLGFLDYVAEIKRKGHRRVFPQLTKKGNNGYADPVGKWFGRLVTGLDLTNPALVFHSLRHGGITKLHDAAVPVNIVETLTGHAAGNVHGQCAQGANFDDDTV